MGEEGVAPTVAPSAAAAVTSRACTRSCVTITLRMICGYSFGSRPVTARISAAVTRSGATPFRTRSSTAR